MYIRHSYRHSMRDAVSLCHTTATTNFHRVYVNGNDVIGSEEGRPHCIVTEAAARIEERHTLCAYHFERVLGSLEVSPQALGIGQSMSITGAEVFRHFSVLKETHERPDNLYIHH
jgi:hypothetical protein